MVLEKIAVVPHPDRKHCVVQAAGLASVMLKVVMNPVNPSLGSLVSLHTFYGASTAALKLLRSTCLAALVPKIVQSASLPTAKERSQ